MNRIRELRKEKHLTMKQFGEMFGISEGGISQYETGKREPSFDLLVRFANFFGVTVDYLLGVDSLSFLRDYQSSPEYKRQTADMAKIALGAVRAA